MADVETKFERLDNRMSFLEQQVSTVAAKVDMLIVESQQQREDMRRLWEKQDAMQARHDVDIKEMNQRFYQKFDAMDAKFDRLSEQIHTMTITAVIGFGAIAVAIGGLIVADLK